MTPAALAKTETLADVSDKNLYESLALRGDLSGLKPEEKAAYYGQLCARLGIDATTNPFSILKLNGKEVMYASKGATDQLARLHNVNRRIVEEKELRGIYVVTVEASLPNGRCEQDKGAVSIDNLKEDALCNAIMKAITKGKRRATLAILGLGLLDETELDTIPNNRIEYPSIQTKAPPAAANEDIPNHSAGEQAMREQIHAAMTAAGVNPANALKKFDTLLTIDDQAAAVWHSLKFAVSGGIAAQNWDLDEIDVFISGFGIESGLESATLAQMEVVFEDMRNNKML